MRLNSRGSQERARALRKLSAIFILVALALLDGGGPAGAADVICYNCPPQWTDFASIDRVGLAIALRPYRRSHDLPGTESCRRAFTIEPQAFHLHV